jgi:uncharacterized protein (DUF3820 family)
MSGLDLDHVLTFGRHRGRTIEDVLEDDPRYLLWVCENVDDFELDDVVAHELERALGPR